MTSASIVTIIIFAFVVMILWELEMFKNIGTAFVVIILLSILALVLWTFVSSTLAHIPTANVIQHELPIQTNY